MLLEGEDALSSLTAANFPTNGESVAATPQNMATEAIDKLIDSLHRTTTTSAIKWSYPSIEDIKFAEKEQLIACKIKRMWELGDKRNTRFHLLNTKK